MGQLHLWIRRETRPTEQRTPLVPADAATLVARGVRISVESSDRRVFADEEYAEAGCDLVSADSWPQAPGEAVILGIKELPEEPTELRHTHVFFAHAYKGQTGAEEVLDRFRRGGGQLLDFEYLLVGGRRVIAFGYWAGYLGAALAVLWHRGDLVAPLRPMSRADLDQALAGGEPARALVTGALGRSGRGAREALTVAGVAVTGWDLEETRDLDTAALLDHDLMVHCVVSAEPRPPFVSVDDAASPHRRLRTIADVTCDVTSANNLLPVNTAVTSWQEPVRRLRSRDTPLDVIAIDNLPSLLPREASVDFSAQLLPLLPDLPTRSGAWAESRSVFEQHLDR